MEDETAAGGPYRWQATDGGSYYSKIGASFTSWEDSINGVRFSPPGASEIRQSWFQWLKAHHPIRNGWEDDPEAHRSWRAGMEAWLCLSNDRRRRQYDDFVLVNDNGSASHEAHQHYLTELADGRPLRQPYPADLLPDWQVLILREITDHLTPTEPGDPRAWQPRAGQIAGQLSELPAIMRGDRLEVIPVLDVAPLIDHLRMTVDDFRDLGAYSIAVVWRREAKTTSGMVIKGTARRYTAAQRDRHPAGAERAPHGEIELPLDIWLAENDQGRRRVVCHELRHFIAKHSEDREMRKLAIRPHSVEGWPEEMAQNGPITHAQARFIAAALKRPRLLRELASWGVSVDRSIPLPLELE